jgi:hypothetical protein
VSSPPFHLRTETDPVSETSCFLVSRIPDDGKVEKTSNPVDCIWFAKYRIKILQEISVQSKKPKTGDKNLHETRNDDGL